DLCAVRGGEGEVERPPGRAAARYPEDRMGHPEPCPVGHVRRLGGQFFPHRIAERSQRRGVEIAALAVVADVEAQGIDHRFFFRPAAFLAAPARLAGADFFAAARFGLAPAGAWQTASTLCPSGSRTNAP